MFVIVSMSEMLFSIYKMRVVKLSLLIQDYFYVRIKASYHLPLYIIYCELRCKSLNQFNNCIV